MTLPERGPAVLLVVGGALATHLVRAILGAFIARGILRLVDADAGHTHPLFHCAEIRVDAHGLPAITCDSGTPGNKCLKRNAGSARCWTLGQLSRHWAVGSLLGVEAAV